MMKKNLPAVRLIDRDEAPELPELSEEMRIAFAEVADSAREGLLAMSVAAEMAVMQAMFDAELAAACGPRGRHDAGRVATRHGRGRGSVV